MVLSYKHDIKDFPYSGHYYCLFYAMYVSNTSELSLDLSVMRHLRLTDAGNKAI